MKILKNKSKVSTIALVLLLMASATLMAMPVKAQQLQPQPSGSQPLPSGVTPNVTVTTTAYLSFRPNPVGVGQTILVNIWITPATSFARYLTGYTVTITKPDNTKVTVGPMNSYYGDATAWFEYVVDQVGTWKLKFEFPGGYFPPGNYCRPGQVTPPGYATVAAGTTYARYAAFYESCYYKPSSTAEQELVVQEEQVLSWPPSPLPTDYWTRPVSPENREWVSIMGDYPWRGPGGGPDWPADTNIYWSDRYRFIPYVQAPNTAHIVWKRQGAISGLIGAGTGIWSFTAGGGNPTVIYQGRCYQTLTKVVNGVPTSVWQCYDLRTGEVYWERTNVTAPTVIEYYLGAGEVPGAEFGAFNMAIVPIYIGGGRLIKYDPWTGDVSVNVSISPLTTGTYYRNGYALTVQNIGTTAAPNYRLINWTTLGPTTNFTERVMNNVTWPWSSVGVCDFEAGVAATSSPITPPAVGAWYGTNVQAASLTTGALLWNITVDDSIFSSSATVADHGKVATCMRDGYWMCWDLYSGKLRWKSELKDYPWGIWTAYSVASAYGMIYDTSYAGIYAFDWNDGHIVWNYKHLSVPYETPYAGENPFRASILIAEGKLYTYNTEHTPSQPITRGWKLHCINATTGEGIWNITGPMSPGAVADGYLTASNTYDGYMYVFGKGKSATTVSASPKTIAKGDIVLIEGTVLDQSPAQPGTPCVSKESMATYMEYLHMQKPIPAGYKVTGVPVMLLAIDADGNVIEIGTVTSDLSGFRCEWTPPDEGLYTITATFMGDDSYGSSWAGTALSVGPAPEAPPPQEEAKAPAYTTIDLVIIAAVVVAIVIGIYSIYDHRKLHK